MDSVRITYRLKPNDFGETVRDFTLRKQPLRTILLGGGFASVVLLVVQCLLIFQTLQHPESEFNSRIVLPLACVGIYVAVLSMYLVVLPSGTRNIWKKKMEFLVETNTEINSEHIRITSINTDSKFGWSNFHEAVELQQYYLVTSRLSKNQFMIIPKRAFESPEHEAAFRAMVEAHLGTIKK